jgi:hypothetical protein
MWWLFNLDNIFIVTVVVVTLYFIITVPKRKYEFIGLYTPESPTPRPDPYEGRPFGSEKPRSRNGRADSRSQQSPHSQSPHPQSPHPRWTREGKCREILNRIYGVRFDSVRPSWLKNPATGKNLELDGYNDSVRTPMGMGLAFECDGEQHSRYVPYFHTQGPKEFVYQHKKDNWKDKVCREKGILLLRIPYFVVPDELETYIRTRLTELNIAPIGGG